MSWGGDVGGREALIEKSCRRQRRVRCDRGGNNTGQSGLNKDLLKSSKKHRKHPKTCTKEWVTARCSCCYGLLLQLDEIIYLSHANPRGAL